MIYHCLFEQSGTFKNEFKKLGYEAYDYDILNDFGQTDYQVDLFNEIEKAYGGGQSILDNITPDDEIICFFPCTRFEQQSLLLFRGDHYGFKNWDIPKKLKYDLKLQQELKTNYDVITKLAIIVYERNLKMIFENPYNDQHYLIRYWCLKPSVIDKDRTERGDYFKKPTMYYFLNRKPSNNIVLEPIETKPKKLVDSAPRNERSLISKEYARRFIQEFIL